MKSFRLPSFQRLYILVVGLTLWYGAALAQEMNKWDSTHRPDIYDSRVELFKASLHRKSDIVMLGNSITFWGDWYEMTGSQKIKNRGIPGDITFGVLNRLDEVIQGKPAKILILIGINDLARNIPEKVIMRNFLRMIKELKAGSPSTKIYIQSLFPVNDTFGKLTNHCNKGVEIISLNTQLKSLTEEENVTFIDLHSHFSDREGKLKKEFTWDGVHLTLAGYQHWVKMLKAKKYL